MNVPRIACTKGRVAGHNIQSWTKRRRRSMSGIDSSIRDYGTERGLSAQVKEGLAKSHVKDLETQQRAKKEAKALDKDFFLSVLNSSATKRDAKSYIQTFSPAEEVGVKGKETLAEQKHTCGVNLGGFYGPAAVWKSPKFVQPGQSKREAGLAKEMKLHVALVKIRVPQTLDDETITGIGRTLAQLSRLGLVSIVVVDCKSKEGCGRLLREVEVKQASRLISAIENNGGTGARLVDNVIGIKEDSGSHSRVHITMPQLLMTPLRRGVIPIIPSMGYTDTSQATLPVPASDIILALTREITGLSTKSPPSNDPSALQGQLRKEEVMLDRLIILDPLGGIPATDRPSGYHVFLNMEQEFEPAKQDLLGGVRDTAGSESPQGRTSPTISDLGFSNSFSEIVEINFRGVRDQQAQLPTQTPAVKPENEIHLRNLQLTRDVLSLLPSTSSALLTTPEEAANSAKDVPFQAAGVGTRPHKNLLIHNLLTDKPVFSSSLPVGRIGQKTSQKVEPMSRAESITPATFAKHGMSIKILPEPKIAPWAPPETGKPQLTLTNSSIDLSRLVYLIEDSFGRTLDVQAYLDRVNDRIAGVIIAGEYEGGAILTWETPPGVPEDGSAESRARMVPYLDKFAVLKRSQGSGGVADLIFKAMVRDCFPDGVVWRSRKNNPVNKWYFERSRGTWKLPDTGWTMFWTTPELSMDEQLFLDSEGVCRNIEPSWADNIKRLD